MPRQTGGDQPPCISRLSCRGHPNVQLAHETTFELESRDVLTPRGDCIACISCEGVEGVSDCAGREGLAVLYIVAANPWDGLAAARVYGLSPGRKPSRLVARKSMHRVDSIIVGSNVAARELAELLGELPKSPFTRCFVLYAVLPFKSTPPKPNPQTPKGNEDEGG